MSEKFSSGEESGDGSGDAGGSEVVEAPIVVEKTTFDVV